MRKNWILLLCFFFFLFIKPVSAMPEIRYDRMEFNPDAMTYQLTGHVMVKSGNRTITADKAVVSLISSEVLAQGNIRLVQDDIVFTGSSAEVRHATHMAEVKGPVSFTQGTTTITADEGTFDWKSKEAVFKGHAVYVNTASKEKAKGSLLRYDVKKEKLIS